MRQLKKTTAEDSAAVDTSVDSYQLDAQRNPVVAKID